MSINNNVNLERFASRADLAEKEVQLLFQQLSALQKTVPALSLPVPEELHKLRAENVKLKYRLHILKKATAKEAEAAPPPATSLTKPAIIPEVTHEGKMTSVLGNLTRIFQNALTQAFPDVPEAPCPVVLSAKQGDYQFNGAMAMAGILKVGVANDTG